MIKNPTGRPLPQVAFKLSPINKHFVGLPAEAEPANLSQGEWNQLKPIDLDWRESWIEAFLAKNSSAIPLCLGYQNRSPHVLRQLADMDIVYIDRRAKIATVVELKKRDGGPASDAVCQLARNLEKASRILGDRFGCRRVRAVVCGSWHEKPIENAKRTCAWHYLKERKASPRFVLFSGAKSPDGSEYFVLNRNKFPFPGKGQVPANPLFEKLERVVRETHSATRKVGLGVDAYRIGERAVVRFTAFEPLKSKYLKSECCVCDEPLVRVFFKVKTKLEGCADLSVKFKIGHRLELMIEPEALDADIASQYRLLHSVVGQIEGQVRRYC